MQKFREYHLFQLLSEFDSQRLPLDLFLHDYFKKHRAIGSKDRAFLAENTYHLIRYKNLLDFLIGKNPTWEKRYDQFVTKPKNIENDESIPLHIRLCCPYDFFQLLQKHYGLQGSIEIAKAINTQAPTTVRINPAKTTRDEIFQKWKEYSVKFGTYSPFAIHFEKRYPLFTFPEFKDGFFEVQDEGSQLLADLIQAKPNQHVLDYCAGSGGKTLAFAHKLNNTGQLYLHDIRAEVLEQAKKRLKRAGIQNAQIVASANPHLKKLLHKMDWVLVDAPCSGTGTWRRNPDMKWRFQSSHVAEIVKEQRKIFEKALEFVKLDGYIVYGTCSLLNEENEEQIKYFLKHFSLTLVQKPFKSIPQKGGMDGFFGAIFQLKNS